jgi:hypothetical protein
VGVVYQPEDDGQIMMSRCFGMPEFLAKHEQSPGKSQGFADAIFCQSVDFTFLSGVQG